MHSRPRPAIGPRTRCGPGAAVLALVAASCLILTASAPAAAGDRGDPKHDHQAGDRHGRGHGDEREHRPPTILWSPGRVEETVVRGGTETAEVSFTSTRDLTDVSLSISRELAPYVTVSPSSIPSVGAGTQTAVTLTLSAPAETRFRARDGVLRLRASGKSRRTYARPLPVRVRFSRNHVPVADAGPDQTSGIEVGDVVLLDGSASRDPDGQALSYTWTLIDVPAESAASLSDPAVVNPAFVADRAGTYTASLTVSDGVWESAPDDVSFTVVVPPPTVSITAPENLSVVTASPVMVSGTVDDPDATIAVNDQPVANTGGAFTASVALSEGGNTVAVVAQNGTGQGAASVEVIFDAGNGPVLTITSPESKFVAGRGFAMGAPFSSAQVDVAGVIKVNTRAILPGLNKPTVTVNGVQADVTLNLFFSGCGLLNPFECWKFAATIPLDQGDSAITAVGTDVAGHSTTAIVHGVVDYCRIGQFDSQSSTPGKDPGVSSLLSDIQSNRCHEIDGCSAPGVRQQCADDPMMCPLLPLPPGGLGTVLRLPLLPIPALENGAPTAFGQGGGPPTGFGNPPEEYFVHGLQSRFDLPCNHHDVCYQTCVPVAGLSVAEREQAWEDAWHQCNLRQFREMSDVCSRAYPARCPYTIGGIPDPVRCALWLAEKTTCSALASAYLLGVESTSNPLGGVSGQERFQQRQADYCVAP
jgi:Glucodextranase, domain B/K319L-like, PKD domain